AGGAVGGTATAATAASGTGGLARTPPADFGTNSATVASVISSAQWHATRCPLPMSRNAGSSVTQFSGLPRRSRSQQRVWNRQPDGGLAGDGTSPASTRRFFRIRGSGFGTADSSAIVYGCRG